MAIAKKSAKPAAKPQGHHMQQQVTKRGTAALNMQKINPHYTPLEVVMTNGTKFNTRSTYNGDTLILDIDPFTHPAWTKQANYVDQKAGEVAKFNNKYSGLFGKKK